MSNKTNDCNTKIYRKHSAFILTLLFIVALALSSYADSGNAAPEKPDYGTSAFGVPTGNGEARDVWSLLSLLLSIIAFLTSTLIITRTVARKEHDEEMWSADEERERRRRTVRRIFRTLGVACAFLTGIMWLFFDNLYLPMAWINRWTIIVAIMFAAFIVCLIIIKTVKRRRDDEDKEDLYGCTRKQAFELLLERTGKSIGDYDWYVNGENKKFYTMIILTFVLAACGAVNWILMSNFNTESFQFGGTIFLILTGVPATITAAFDRDWILLGDDIGKK